MRKKFYHYNKEEIRRNRSRKMRKNAARLVCITTLSATMLGSVPWTQNASAYTGTQSGVVSMSELSMEGAVTYDLSDTGLITTKKLVDYRGKKQEFHIIDINITKNGTYIIKGSNEVNGAYVDTHIAVAEGVEADIIFDGARIKNDDAYCSDINYCTGPTYSKLFPLLEINGTANIYTREDSRLEAEHERDYTATVSVSGLMRMRQLEESEKQGTLEIVSFLSAIGTNTSRTGKFYMEGGSLSLDGGIGQYGDALGEIAVTGGTLAIASNIAMCADRIRISGGRIQGKSVASNLTVFDGNKSTTITGGVIKYDGVKYGDDVISFGGANIFQGASPKIMGGTFDISGLPDGWRGRFTYSYDACGNKLFLRTLEDLPANAQITAVNGRTVTDTPTGTGSVRMMLPEGKNAIRVDDETYVYQYDGTKMVRSEEQSCQVSLHIKEGEEEVETKEIRVAQGTVITKLFRNDPQYEYTYRTKDGEVIEDDTEITGDMDIYLTRQPKKYALTINNGEREYVPYGTKLEEGYLYCDPDYPGKLYYPGDEVTYDMKIMRIPAVKENGQWWILIETEEDVSRVNTFITNCRDLNIRLETDLDMQDKNNWSLITGRYYKGILDGNGHMIKNLTKDISYGSYSITRELHGTVKNLQFQNITFQRNYNDADGTGVICGRNYGTIENCSFENVSIITMEMPEDVTSEDDSQTVLVDKGIIAGWNMGQIRHCYTSGSSITGDGKGYELARNIEGTIEDSYYLSKEETEDGGRTAEQFASGEICWELNGGVTDGTQRWYQNIDGDSSEDYVKDLFPVMAPDHDTVRVRYDGCTRKYTNHEPNVPVHDLVYSAEGNVLTAVCRENTEHAVTAVVTAGAKSIEYDGKSHAATVSCEYSDGWIGEKESYEIVYTRQGQETTDLTSPGTITASITAGGVTAKTEYIIKKTVTPSPVPTDAPSQIPTVSPAITLSPDQSGKPEASREPGTTSKPEESVTPVPGQSEKPETSREPGTTKKPEESVTPAPVQSEKPETSREPETTSKPEESVTPAPVQSEKPETSREPETTSKPEESVMPSPGQSEKPETSREPGTTKEPEESVTPVPGQSEKPEPTKKPEETVTPAPSPGETTEPTKKPEETVTPAPNPSETTEPTKEPDAAITPAPVTSSTPKLLEKKGVSYQVTKAGGKNPAVAYQKNSEKSKKNIKVPDTVTIGGVKYKVTSIAPKAFSNNKKLTRITIGKNVEEIGKKAFYNCRNLRNIRMESTRLTGAKVGNKAFAGINEKAVVTVPDKKRKAYEKWLQKKGLTATQKVVSDQ